MSLDDKNKQDKHSERRELLTALSNISQIGILIVSCVIIGVMAGRFLDNLFGTSPWLLLFFSLLGMAAAFKSIFDYFNRK
ncbi:MAG: AtpZ/AtpI family protein [Oscillospiraceae bacterium]|nr:AtpZ/AtpI family protein [Oscillospiraceae bacterium]